MAIPNQSLYHKVVAAKLDEISQERRRLLKEQALAQGRLQEWKEAVRIASEALRLGEDEELSGKIKEWNENSRLQQQMKRARTLAATVTEDSLTQARQILATLPEHELTRRAPAMIEEIDKQLFDLRIAALYAAGDEKGVDALRASPLATSVTARRIFTRMDAIRKLLAEGEEALKEKRYFDARSKWEGVLSQESSAENVFRKKALARLDDWPLSKIGESERLAGIQAFSEGQYQNARKHLEVARVRCGVDVSSEVEQIQKLGKSLYNEAANDIMQGMRTQARDKLLRARECFLSTERWYEKVEKRLRKEYGS